MARKIELAIVAICENNSRDVNDCLESVINNCGTKIKPHFAVLDNSAPSTPFKLKKRLKPHIKPLIYLDNTQSLLINYVQLMTSTILKIPASAFVRDFTIQWLMDNLKDLTGVNQAREFILIDARCELRNCIDFVDPSRGYSVISDVISDHGRYTLNPLIQYFCADTFKSNKIKYFDYDPENPIFTEDYRSGDYAIRQISANNLPFRKVDSDFYVYLPKGLRAAEMIAKSMGVSTESFEKAAQKPQYEAPTILEDAIAKEGPGGPASPTEQPSKGPSGATSPSTQSDSNHDSNPHVDDRDLFLSLEGPAVESAPSDSISESASSDSISDSASSDSISDSAVENSVSESASSDSVSDSVVENSVSEPVAEDPVSDSASDPDPEPAPVENERKNLRSEIRPETDEKAVETDEKPSETDGEARKAALQAAIMNAFSGAAGQSGFKHVRLETKQSVTEAVTEASDPLEAVDDRVVDFDRVDYVRGAGEAVAEKAGAGMVSGEMAPAAQVKTAPSVSPVSGTSGMDVVYVLGNGSKWRNNELRYSLRSLDRNGRSYGRVFIICEDLPRFVLPSSVIQIRWKDDPSKAGWRNVFDKLCHALRTTDISERFVFMMDDVILKEVIDFGQMPVYSKGVVKPEPMSGSGQKWKASKNRTIGWLRAAGVGAIDDYEVHFPAVYEKGRYLKLAERLAGDGDPLFLQVRSIYYNTYLPRKKKVVRDCKLKVTNMPGGIRGFEGAIRGSDCFSLSDVAVMMGVGRKLEEMFPKMSRFEREAPLPPGGPGKPGRFRALHYRPGVPAWERKPME